MDNKNKPTKKAGGLYKNIKISLKTADALVIITSLILFFAIAITVNIAS